MKIAFINGSPKLGKSNSDRMLSLLEKLIQDGNTITHYNISRGMLSHGEYLKLLEMDALVFAFPLYVDAIPSHLFRMLIELGQYRKEHREREIFVYALLNNGFYEGHQNGIAVDILKNWCSREGFTFGQAIGQGAGEMMAYTETVPLGHGPHKNLGPAMTGIAEAILSRKEGDSTFVSPNVPRLFWKLMAHHGFWRKRAVQNGLKPKDILAKPE